MACLINYKNKSYTEEEFKVVASLHESIKNALKEGGLFKEFKNKLYYTKNDINKINKEYERIYQLNTKYGNKVITLNKGNREVFINVNPIADLYIKAKKPQVNTIQLSIFQVDNEGKSKDLELENKLKEFLKTNNIKVEFYDNLKSRLKLDVAGAYDVINKLVLISNEKSDKSTLPEEIGHVIVETLGTDNLLVKSLLTNLKNVDYKSMLSKDYLDMYKDNEDLLIRELAGQLIGKTLTGESIEIPTVDKKNRVIELINKIFNVFKKLFNIPISSFQDYHKEIIQSTKKIAEKVLNNEKFEYNSQTNPDHPIFYQIKNSKEGQDETAKKKKLIYFKNVLKRLESDLAKSSDPDEVIKLTDSIEELKTRIDLYKESSSNIDLMESGKVVLDRIRTLIFGLQTRKVNKENLTANDITFIHNSLEELKLIRGLTDEVLDLKDQFREFKDSWIQEEVNKYSTLDKEISLEEIEMDNEDINRARYGFGALSDVSNILGRTIGSVIKQAQNRSSTFTKQISKEIEKEVDLLLKKESNYDIFIQEAFGTTILTNEYTTEYFKDKSEAINKIKNSDPEGTKWFKNNHKNGKVTNSKYFNPNYIKIQKTPHLKRFYDFYNKIMLEAGDKIPAEIKSGFIANIKDQTLIDTIKNKGFVAGLSDFIKAQDEDNFIKDEDLLSDVVPLKYIKKISSEEKSRNLGDSLARFASFAHTHYEMSEILPQVRVLQNKIEESAYIKSNNPNLYIEGSSTNIYKLVDDYVNVQIKGRSKDPMMKIGYEVDVKNDKGETVKEKKYFHLSTIIDMGLRYNSILRIGFNPFNAATNVVVGDIGNMVEGFGGRFYNLKELKQASNIYFNQINKKDSKLIKILELLNPLQEFEDYQYLNKIKNKKIDKDKILEYAYKMQAKGESFLQIRTMIASLLHDTIEDKQGNKVSLWEAFNEKGEWNVDKFGELDEFKVGQMSDKIQRINQMIHGRYSAKDSAALSQNVLFRTVFQFRKWIPSAIEARLAGYQYDNRLGSYVEGRWKTLGRLVKEGLTPEKRSYMNMIESLFKAKDKLTSENLDELEIANMRKNLAEVALILASLLFGSFLFDDDWRKENKEMIKNPFIEFSLNQLDRVSGDLLFFANPKQLNNLALNAAPLAKTVDQMITTSLNIPYMFGGEDSEYTKGRKEGENKFWSNIGDLIPFNKPVSDVGRLFKDGQ
jgi:hypothetical protein